MGCGHIKDGVIDPGKYPLPTPHGVRSLLPVRAVVGAHGLPTPHRVRSQRASSRPRCRRCSPTPSWGAVTTSGRPDAMSSMCSQPLMGCGHGHTRRAGSAADTLPTPHGVRSRPHELGHDADSGPPNPSWGAVTCRVTPPISTVQPSQPLMGCGHVVDPPQSHPIQVSQPLMGCGHRRVDASTLFERMSSQPLMGCGHFQHGLRVAYGDGLPTPHGVRSPGGRRWGG